eukprot:TRINITY_DN329_c0_g1_i1.p1 TRINITY_DN329_c0_g1~~TRINITY_DN329_c0_g1_i1.p1  ORF type:complete len:406 (+),score=36.69 TRINITY_DN329_c0_g1_i1:165-1382(+)
MLGGIFKGHYTTAKGLQNLSTYKYVGVDNSLVAKHIMQPIWTRLVYFLPMWMAPNLVTLIGFLFIIMSYLLTVVYTPLLVGEAPIWVYLCNALFMLIYQTMDALDGKQARRTGTSSPLGELFDHGCDAVTTVLSTLTIMGCLQTGATFFSLFTLISLMAAFYLTQWEEYFTGILELGLLGVTEGQISVMGMYLLTVYFGPQFWTHTFTIPSFIPLIGNIVLTRGQIPMLISLGGAYATILSNFVTVKKCFQNKSSISDHPTTLTNAIIGTLSIIFLSVLSYYWAYISPSRVLQKHPQLLMITVGLLAAILVGRIVLARVCKVIFPPFLLVIIPIILVPTLHLFKPDLLVVEVFNKFGYKLNFEEAFLYFYTLVAILGYLHLALSVIDDFCGALKIRCLHIPKRSA